MGGERGRGKEWKRGNMSGGYYNIPAQDGGDDWDGGTRAVGKQEATRYICKTVSKGYVTDGGLGVQDVGGVSGLIPRHLGG